jgi:hypothetical protein
MTIKTFPERWAERLAYLASRHITCFDPEWRGRTARYHFRCELGHEWSRPGSVLPGRLDCRICGRLEKAALTCWPALIEAGRPHGTVCLDTRWLGCRHRYRFRCKDGHEWSRTGSSQTKHPTCPECFKQRLSVLQFKRANLDPIKDIARQRGGECLSDQYEGSAVRYAFRCAKGHEWQTRVGSIQSGSWCPLCDEAARGAAKLLTDGLERLQRKAAERGGECLSGAYLGTAVKYRFRCAQSHEFETTGNKLFLGVWCRHCAFDAKRLSIDHAHEAARAKGGECLSTTYVNSSIKLKWRCHRGHEWGAPLSNVRAGHWCRACADIAMITNPRSKARRKYDDGGAKHIKMG